MLMGQHCCQIPPGLPGQFSQKNSAAGEKIRPQAGHPPNHQKKCSDFSYKFLGQFLPIIVKIKSQLGNLELGRFLGRKKFYWAIFGSSGLEFGHLAPVWGNPPGSISTHKSRLKCLSCLSITGAMRPDVEKIIPETSFTLAHSCMTDISMTICVTWQSKTTHL
jgi:hypothetical protein